MSIIAIFLFVGSSVIQELRENECLVHHKLTEYSALTGTCTCVYNASI